jgi:hypothetical protein
MSIPYYKHPVTIAAVHKAHGYGASDDQIRTWLYVMHHVDIASVSHVRTLRAKKLGLPNNGHVAAHLFRQRLNTWSEVMRQGGFEPSQSELVFDIVWRISQAAKEQP